MKKLFYAVFAALFALCSCQMDELAGHVEEDVLYVKIEESSVTKTYMGAGNKVLWSDGDQIAAFMKSYEAAKYQVSGESVGNSSAVFTKVSGSGSSGNSAPQHNVAFYPYSFVSSLSKSGNNYVADVNVPAVQTYRSESFDDGFFPMAAVSKDNTLSFRNICGAVNLRLTGSQKVKSVSLSGNSGEKISGAGTVTVYPDNSAPYLKMKSSASSSVTLDCGDGVQLNESQATSFVIVLPPVEFSKGFTMTVTDSEGAEYEIRTEKSNSISRSNIHAVPVQKLGDDFGGETDAPEYIDEYGVNHGPGVEIDGVVWAPVNCGYHKTDYKYGKLYQWGRKYGQGYSGDIYDINGNKVGTYSDVSVPSIESGPVSLGKGQSKDNSNVFYTSDDSPYDWLFSTDYNLWNTGTESIPVKTEYDPCPEGWRVPTYAELSKLSSNRSSLTIDENGHIGRWLSGSSPYSSNSPIVFFSAAGNRAFSGGSAYLRCYSGNYWTSGLYNSHSYCLDIYGSKGGIYGGNRATGYSVRCVQDEGELIPVSSVSINKSSLTMEIGETQTLSATISPSDANHKTAYWWSEDESVATVDKTGKVTAVSSGVTTITAMAGMKQATCTVTVNAPVSNQKEYIDENGVNHGPGVEIDGVVWAPVNCGYHETDYPWGKLYQWGRKDGQGYSDEDETSAVIMSGPVSLYTGQLKTNEAKFYKNNTSPYDWLSSSESNLWNLGTEGNPIKTEYDPCPEGWRVPTYSELKTLSVHSSWGQNEDGQNGLWFSGLATSTDAGSKVFFSAAGGIYYTAGSSLYRDSDGSYWSSRPYGELSYELRVCNNPKNVGMGGYYRATGYSVRCVQDEEELIPVSSVSINKSSLTMEIGEIQTLSATISPSDANHKTAYWWSEDETVATVDKNGKVTAVSSGVTTITAMAGMKHATCTVTVNAPASNMTDYIDEYGVNHGQGIEIDGVVWAPVNCGYQETDYKYGKLYQWGRKYGQGYSGNIYDINGNYVEKYSDASVPSIKSGPVSLSVGQSKSNSNVFYTSDSEHHYDWLSTRNDYLWNAGTESNPVKSEYDPCPEGWRVPTEGELEILIINYSSWTTDENGQIGYWFSGSSSYSKLFLPAAGYRDDGSGAAYSRGRNAYYSSSKMGTYFYGPHYIGFNCDEVYVGIGDCARGYSVRCVQE